MHSTPPTATPAAAKAAKVHAFTLAGFGAAPFKLFRVDRNVSYCACQGAPVQPGGACDFCGTGIYDHYWIRSADGIEFKVGCDCVRKTGDKGLRAQLNDADRAKRTAAAGRKHDRDMLRVWTAWAKRDDVAATLASKPHPKGFKNRETGEALTLLDWADWMMAHAGTSGRLQVAGLIEGALS